MKSITYEDATDLLVVDDEYEVPHRSWFDGYVAPFEQVSEVSLVAFRKAAGRFCKTRPQDCLRLGWADYPTDLFEKGDPSPELTAISSDGKSVTVECSLSVSFPDQFPEPAEDLGKLVRHSVKPLLSGFGASIKDIAIEPYDPTQSRGIDVALQIAPQRRTLGEAAAFGESVRDSFDRDGSRLLKSPMGVISALTWAPAALVGRPESTWLEAKRQPYNLDIDTQRFELAKDVAALANSEGGIVIFGFSTKGGSGKDVISRARSIDTTSVTKLRYQQIIRARIFPMPEKLEIVRVGEGKAGFAYIRVPPQPEELRPFVLRSTVSGSGVKMNLLAIPVRTGATVEYSSPESIHSLIVAGRAALRTREQD